MTMNKQTETALKMAIEALKDACGLTPRDAHFCKAIQACKEALEQPAQEYLTRAQQVIRANNSAQEPVAWMHRHEGEILEFNDFQSCDKCEPLYTHHAPSFIGLSDDEIQSAPLYDEDFYRGAKWAEQALKEKNER